MEATNERTIRGATKEETFNISIDQAKANLSKLNDKN